MAITTNQADNDKKSFIEASTVLGQPARAVVNPDGTPVGGVGSTTSVTTLGHGSRTVATAGTDVQLSTTSVPCNWVTLEAYRSNTGYIAVGGSGVDAAAAGSGITLAGTNADTVTIPVKNLNAVYIDATVSGEGVRYTYGV